MNRFDRKIKAVNLLGIIKNVKNVLCNKPFKKSIDRRWKMFDFVAMNTFAI